MMKRTSLAILTFAGLGLAGCVPPAAEIQTQAAPPAAPAATPPAADPAPVSGAAVPGVYTSGEQRWFKDQYGRCYRINSQGDRAYDAAQQC